MNLYDKTEYCEIKTLNDVKGYEKWKLWEENTR